ncbi:MAG: hypothetical protein G3M78_01640 [Candidatus Nitrohelix vancouverensis]|uniref:DUF4136 domain-containing protein n=1 Tax=Candidatus Nitrohelix vancouverensis TaxID=2705534 RepID=A0A7T0G2F5_9BACT|nr:MAG: hypothetical protein G3M78_01640 [Candidatus Nitrohelix vancouverensis]
MKKIFLTWAFILLTASACTGVDTQVKKRWSNPENTLILTDLTSKDYEVKDAGLALMDALEDALIANSSFVIAHDAGRYQLKYKILNYNKGNRAARIATFGLMDSAKCELKVKVALYDGENLVGGWVVESWQKDGIRSEETLFQKAAQDIIAHLRGGF